ncbi:MAG TPA: prepilin-type N-terminal cleavage/methylation domain-containing protein [Gemmatimonadaceae bacterium]|jgi:prepilin-type N-terminal cleavage/methylation domain-containing protein
MKTLRRGVTLLELLVTLVLLGMIAAVATVGAARIRSETPTNPQSIVAESLRVAITENRAITFDVPVGDTMATATVSPDGSIVADSAIHIDALSGRPVNAR